MADNRYPPGQKRSLAELMGASLGVMLLLGTPTDNLAVYSRRPAPREKPTETQPIFRYRPVVGCVDEAEQAGNNLGYLGECGDLRGANLRAASLEGVNLAGAILSGVDLTQTNLNHADLRGAVLSGSILWSTQLKGADLTGSDLSGAHLSEVDLAGAKLVQADLTNAVLRNLDLRSTELEAAKLVEATLFGVDLSGLDLRTLDWQGAELPFCNLSGASLRGMDFKGGFWDRTEFVRADLREIDLTEAELHRVNLIGADLRGATLKGAQLLHADLTGAQLQGADLSRANLSRADLSDATLSQARLQQANLTDARLPGANLQEADLVGATLYGCVFQDADLRGADLSQARFGQKGKVINLPEGGGSAVRPTQLAGALCNDATRLPESAEFLCQEQRITSTTPREITQAPGRPDLLPVNYLTPGTPPNPDNWLLFLESIRATVLAYTDSLPNFICIQATSRYSGGGLTGWRRDEYYEMELSFYDKREHYRSLIGNQTRPHSTGQFGSALRALFAPQTNSLFRLEAQADTNGRPTVQISYQVPKDTSSKTITFNNQGPITAGYQGDCWIDLESYQVTRLEERTTDLPKSFPVQKTEVVIEYGPVNIAGADSWLPLRVEEILETDVPAALALGVGEGAAAGSGRVRLRSVTLFERYRKFEADVKFVTE